MEKTVTVMDMMDAREKRAAIQQEMLRDFPSVLLCFTMNIAGPVKDSPLIRQGFREGILRVQKALAESRIPILAERTLLQFTGCEAYFCLDAPLLTVKALACRLEEADALGRLFDLDVLDSTGQKADREMIGFPARRCLLCGRPARECARSRAHSVPELQERTHRILAEALSL